MYKEGGDMDKIDRVRQMEARMDRAEQWIKTISSALDRKPSVQDDIYELAAYYESSQWMEDYESEEAGELPADLKRGVLSEDGLYNLLMEYDELMTRLRQTGERRKW